MLFLPFSDSLHCATLNAVCQEAIGCVPFIGNHFGRFEHGADPASGSQSALADFCGCKLFTGNTPWLTPMPKS